MELKLVDDFPNYTDLIELINAEWPPQFGDKTDSEKIADMRDSYSIECDRTKLLYDDGILIGFYRYTLWPRGARITEAAHIYDIALLPERQKLGLGMFLMQDLISDCKDRKLKKLLSRSFNDNKASMALHRKAGFHISLEKDDSILWELIL
ncbi:MAG: GNAT family N-acetyltransferase [Spirochaetales bacterium]|nr:GNAT family N-acetyltransferase [Spirochaetales bacterium]